MRRAAAVLLLLACLLSGCASAPEPVRTPADAAPPNTSAPVVVPVPTPSPESTPSPSPLPESSAPEAPAPEPADEDFVLVADYIPNLYTSLAYATQDNFTGQIIYDFQEAWLRYGTVKKLSAAARELEEAGYGLLIWDAFRPVWAQFRLWEVCPNANFVANPTRGFSSHSRGNTVDLTLTDLDGVPVEMPSGFDEFSALADRDYSDVSRQAADNAQLLEDVLTRHGFQGYRGEWWHYSDADRYPVEESFSPPASAPVG